MNSAADTTPLPSGLHLEAMTEAHLDRLLPIELQAHGHPWSRGNFADALKSGYWGQVLLRDDQLLGYFVAMLIVDEFHLLNITVAPQAQRQGLGRLLMEVLRCGAQANACQSLWLEVRESNLAARALYQRQGFEQVGARKRYYPVEQGERETAIIMSLTL